MSAWSASDFSGIRVAQLMKVGEKMSIFARVRGLTTLQSQTRWFLIN
jgi:hypothetical protein